MKISARNSDCGLLSWHTMWSCGCILTSWGTRCSNLRCAMPQPSFVRTSIFLRIEPILFILNNLYLLVAQKRCDNHFCCLWSKYVKRASPAAYEALHTAFTRIYLLLSSVEVVMFSSTVVSSSSSSSSSINQPTRRTRPILCASDSRHPCIHLPTAESPRLLFLKSVEVLEDIVDSYII